MRIVLRPGHGLTPPRSLAYSRFTQANRDKSDSAFPRWHLQRPGNREDDYNARFCADHLIPALVRAKHEVVCQRAIDNVTGELDTTEITIGPETFPQLRAIDAHTCERWTVNAAVEAVLRGDAQPEWTRGMGWSHDPVISCWVERQTPADLYLSIHQNWYTNPGYFGPVVMYCKGSTQGRKYARTVFGSVADSMGQWGADAGIEWGTPERNAYIARGGRGQLTDSGLWELRRTRAPAVRVELGFQSNVGDAALMGNPDWRERMAQSIVDGLTLPS